MYLFNTLTHAFGFDLLLKDCFSLFPFSSHRRKRDVELQPENGKNNKAFCSVQYVILMTEITFVKSFKKKNFIVSCQGDHR